MTDINNKIAFVTGAASGIGFALCKGLLDKGAKVMMSDIDAAGLEAAYHALGAGENLGTVVCDVADETQVKAAAQATIDQFGKVHLVFNNAGVSLPGRPGKFLLTRPSDIQRSTTCSNSLRNKSLSRNRPCRALENVEWFGTTSSMPNWQNQR